MEPQKAFSQNTVVYGNVLYPENYNILSNTGQLNKKSLIYFATDWIKEINKAYILAPELANREMREYPFHLRYTDASGSALIIEDPNTIMRYFNELKQLTECSLKTGITDIYALGNITGVSTEIIEQINEIKDNYEKYLVRR